MSRVTMLRTMLYIGSLVALVAGRAGFWKSIGILLCVHIATGGWRFIRIVILTVHRDLKSLYRLKKTQLFLYLLRRRNATVPTIFKEVVKRHPDRTVFHYEDKKWTFRQLDEFSNQVANCFTELGFHPGEEVAIFMDSKPEFVALWLGLAKAGIVSALINTNQRLTTLVHSVTTVNSKALIFGSELTEAVEEVADQLSVTRPIQYLCFGQLKGYKVPARSLDELIAESSTQDPVNLYKGNFNDRLFYIYTSGTTGLPKAAIIKHHRYVWMGSALRNMIGLKRYECIYTCLPLYHLAGGCLGTCQSLIFGDTMAIRSKFSATKFWEDCIKYECTAAQYIGEICRYLLAQPERPADKQHKVRMIMGNGLRPKIWPEFVQRFNIKEVGEFYGSTEGNANVINVDNKSGSCGFISQILPQVYPVTLIRVNEQTGEPYRNENGLAQQARPGQVGEFVGKIIQTDPTRAFDGYVNKEATEKKIVRNVFRKGDMCFSSGDLLLMDELGYLYFKDRTGDTYRWKGENVSTMEVEAVISNILKQTDCIVYGVPVPNCEGKAGMVTILDPKREVNLNDFLTVMRRCLAPFAIPVFLRIVDVIEATGTYKLPKVALQKEAYDFDVVKDPLYVLNAKENRYDKITSESYKEIMAGAYKL